MLMKIKYPADRSEAASGGTCQVVALANFWQLGASKKSFEAPSSCQTCPKVTLANFWARLTRARGLED